MNREALDPRLPLVQDADLAGKTVLVRVDHNVVKKGEIRDPYRIDATLGTLYSIVESGGRPILMTHVGRPRDKKTGKITVSDDTSVEPVVEYLERKLHTTFAVPKFQVDPENGIEPGSMYFDGDEYKIVWEFDGDAGYVIAGEHSWFLIFSSDNDWTAGDYEIKGPDDVPVPVPEPAAIALLGIGSMLALLKRRRYVN